MASTDYTVEGVKEHIEKTFTAPYVATAEGQAHLNRVGKAATNESIELRKTTNKNKKAEAAYNAVLAKLLATAPEEVDDFTTLRANWIEEWITKNK